jgi:two-component system KDP operon response regulator KdpE
LVYAARPELVLLDLGLPDLDGRQVLRSIRSASALPVIVISARSAENDQVDALDGGANDYVTKPFRERELLARVRVALRRGEGSGNEDGDLKFEAASRRVWVRGKEAVLTATELELFNALYRRSGDVVTHARLLREIWGEAHTHRHDYLRVYIRSLRQKLEPDAKHPKYLLTVLGVGYRLKSRIED